MDTVLFFLCVGTWFCVVCESAHQQKTSTGGTLSQWFVCDLFCGFVVLYFLTCV